MKNTGKDRGIRRENEFGNPKFFIKQSQNPFIFYSLDSFISRLE